jgi:hypothetical protein
MTIFFQNCGPMIKYSNNVLLIEDLNPEAKLTWRVSKLEAITIGLRLILAAFTTH